MSDCLILVDLQNDYFPGGSMELSETSTAAANAQLLLNKFWAEKRPIVHIQHLAIHSGATFFLPETEGAEINEMVKPHAGESLVVKNFPNSFRETELLNLLKKAEIDSLVICGAMSHMCIDATTRAAADLGFNCIVAEDACATTDLTFKDTTVKAADVHASFMAALAAAYAQVMPTSEII